MFPNVALYSFYATNKNCYLKVVNNDDDTNVIILHFSGFNKTSIADFYDKLEKEENGRSFSLDDANSGALVRHENGKSGQL